MSNVIDQKVVEMRFDNKQFENNVQTSLSTLDRLKKSLNLEGATKGLENVDAASKKLNFSGLSSAVETVQAKFSAFEVMAVTALANITNSAINAGKQMLRSLTLEPVSQGFNEYELKMGSIQTIMASTGASLKEVNGYLNELNTYADKTIYSFSDMTNNIGKFTNAGVKLEDAVLAIKGVSNEAAVSGANANEASRAMYNFAQALSAGYVKLIDWKSIENANMATVEFKNELLKAAEAAGTVKKQADGMYRVLTKNNQGSTMDLAIDATKNFNDSLNYQWMTTEVLVISEICRLTGLGFKVTLNDKKQFVFKLYAGADRTYAQTENPYVVFSPKFENIANSNYLESKKEYKNVALVAGEGEGAERKTTSVGEGSGLERRELFVDARDISTTTEDNVTLSDEEYKKQLAQRGDEKLAESVAAQSFEGQVEMTKMFEYGKDFFIGDIVQIANEYGMESRARISEIVTAIDTQGTVTYPTLSTVT